MRWRFFCGFSGRADRAFRSGVWDRVVSLDLCGVAMAHGKGEAEAPCRETLRPAMRQRGTAARWFGSCWTPAWGTGPNSTAACGGDWCVLSRAQLPSSHIRRWRLLLHGAVAKAAHDGPCFFVHPHARPSRPSRARAHAGQRNSRRPPGADSSGSGLFAARSSCKIHPSTRLLLMCPAPKSRVLETRPTTSQSPGIARPIIIYLFAARLVPVCAHLALSRTRGRQCRVGGSDRTRAGLQPTLQLPRRNR